MKTLYCVNRKHNKWFNSSFPILKHASYSPFVFFFFLFQFDLYHPCNAIQNVTHALTSIRGHRNLNKNPGLMCPCLTLYVDRVLGHQSFGVRFQCSVCRSSWHLCWTWRGKKEKKKNFTAAEHRVPETKQYSRQGRARSFARKHARLFFLWQWGFIFFRLIIIIRCRVDLEARARRVKAYLGKYVIDVIDFTSRALLNQYKIKTLSCACPLQPARVGLHVQRIFKPRPSTECAFTWVGCGRGARVWPRVSRSEATARAHNVFMWVWVFALCVRAWHAVLAVKVWVPRASNAF